MERSKLLRVLFVALGVVGVLAIAAGIFVVSLLREDMSKVELRFRLEPGKAYAFHHEAAVESRWQSDAGQEQNASSAILDYTFEVKEADAEGNAKINVTCDRLQLKQSGAAGDVSYDSSATSEVPPAWKGQVEMLAQDFSMTLSPKGWVLALALKERAEPEQPSEAESKAEPEVESGADMDVVKMLQAELEQYREKTQGDLKAEGKKLSPIALQMLVQSSLAVYPEGPVGPGDTWQRRLDLPGAPGQMPLQTFEFRRHNNGLAVIVVRSEGVAQFNPSGSVRADTETSGSVEGTIEVDKATGHICSAEVRGEATVSSRTPAGGLSLSIEEFERHTLLPKE